MTEQERITKPLSDAEALAAFVATVYAIDGGSCRSGFGRISHKNDRSVDFTFTLPNFLARKVIDSHPEHFEWATKYFADPKGA